tara:strand:+ start:719 stop:943 length:225 start_codon:yes stop_codon:yes gene_type:complete
MIRYIAINLVALASTFCIISGFLLITETAVAVHATVEWGGTVTLREKVFAYFLPFLYIILGIILQAVTYRIYKE